MKKLPQSLHSEIAIIEPSEKHLALRRESYEGLGAVDLDGPVWKV